MVEKFCDAKQAAALVKDGMTLMIGGFLGCGTPETIIDEIVASGVKDLILVVNDTSFPEQGIGKLIVNNQVKRVYASHVGTNPETGNKMNDGSMEVILQPQGTLAEQIRAGGAGLGGIITPTGLGTVVEEGKQKIEIDGKTYLIEKPLRADIAFIRAEVVDKKGNAYYQQSAQNFNPLMAMAADHVVVEAGTVVEVGELQAEHVHTPHIFVDAIVKEDARG